MMDKIYCNATGTITYLGPATDDVLEEKGIALLNKLYEHYAPHYDRFYELGSLVEIFNWIYSRSDVEVPGHLCFGNSPDLGWRWLVRLAYGVWTQRSAKQISSLWRKM